jgi:hypothetical protein
VLVNDVRASAERPAPDCFEDPDCFVEEGYAFRFLALAPATDPFTIRL